MQKHPRIFKQKKIQSGNDDEGSSENHNRQFRRVLLCNTENPFRTYLELDLTGIQHRLRRRRDREGSEEKKRRTFPMCQLNTNSEVVLNSIHYWKLLQEKHWQFHNLQNWSSWNFVKLQRHSKIIKLLVKSIDPSVEPGMEPVFTSTKWNAYIWRDSHN